MKRRALFSAAFSTMAASALPLLLPRTAMATSQTDFPLRGKPVKPPAHGPLQVAFLVGPRPYSSMLPGPGKASLIPCST